MALDSFPPACSPRGLVGNTLSCDTGEWERTDAGVGAGVDSFYEYLLKARRLCWAEGKQGGFVGTSSSMALLPGSGRAARHAGVRGRAAGPWATCGVQAVILPRLMRQPACRPTWRLGMSATCICSRRCMRQP